MLIYPLAKIIGSGVSTNIWTDAWAGTKEYKLVPPVSSNMSNEDFEECRVSQHMDHFTKQRDVNKIYQLVPPYQRASVLGTPVSLFHDEDKWTWKFTADRHFTVKSDYQKIKEICGKTNNMTQFFQMEDVELPRKYELFGIWKLEVPGKIKLFLWKLANNGLPLNTKRNHIFPNTSPLRVLCQEQDETTPHLFT